MDKNWWKWENRSVLLNGNWTFIHHSPFKALTLRKIEDQKIDTAADTHIWTPSKSDTFTDAHIYWVIHTTPSAHICSLRRFANSTTVYSTIRSKKKCDLHRFFEDFDILSTVSLFLSIFELYGKMQKKALNRDLHPNWVDSM